MFSSSRHISNPSPMTTRFNRLTWGYIHSSRPKGVLAGGFENGELALWDAEKVLSSSGDAEILRNNQHTGPVRGLDFNSVQTNLLASGATNGEIFIWDLANPSRPYSPGARSNKLDEITALAWNAKVPQILATSSNSGNTVVWDLKGKREVAVLSYGGSGAGGAGGMGSMGMNGSTSGRRGVGAVCWHPEQPTRLVTSSEDDNNPVIMVWNLRNALAPELILSGHSKGILSMSWCKQDEDLLVSCGKDNRTILWNPQTGEMVGELPSSSNWTFDVQWSPRNPDLLATASFDGKIGVHSLQAISANDEAAAAAAAAQAQAQSAGDGADFFNNMPTAVAQPGVSLKQPPKWLRRPVSATFAFGGQLVSVANLTGPTGKVQSSVVHTRDVVTEPTIVERAHRLQDALANQSLADFCDEKSKEADHARPDDATNWKALQTLFKADSRDELVTLLGFSKQDVADKVAKAVASFKEKSGAANITTAAEDTEAEETATAAAAAAAAAATAASAEPVESETTTEAATTEAAKEEPGLFGDASAAPGSAAASADFFGQIGTEGDAPKSALPSHLADTSIGGVPSAAATHGSAGISRAGSRAGSDITKPSTFRIYPSNESEADRLITRALVLGDFESAVSLCISADRFADAILLAVRGGEDLLAKTQKLYFEQRTTSTPYLRLYQSIVSDDLADVVQNADLAEWEEIFVVLCTFARSEDFGNLAEQLGQRLEMQYIQAKSKDARKNAVMCYLAAGKLEKVASIWIDEMKEEEELLRSGQAEDAGGLYGAHAEALQTFIEKTIVFQHAVGYVDTDLQQPTGDAYVAENGLRVYKLASLYDRLQEYVDLLADQGLISPALSFVNQIPADYRGARSTAQDNASTHARERLQHASLSRPSESAQASSAAATNSLPAAAQSQNYASNAYAPVQPSVPAAAPVAAADPYSQAANPFGMPAAQPYQSAQQTYDPYGYGAPQQQTWAPPQSMVPAPPQPASIAPPPAANLNQPLPPPPPIKRDTGTGWNDVPMSMSNPRRTTSAMGSKAQAITSPFPNAPAPAPYGTQQPTGPPQGPPRGSTPSRGTFTSPPPPPQAGGFAMQGQRPNVQVGAPPAGRGAGAPPPPQGMARAPSAGPGRPGMPPQQPSQMQQQSGPYGPPPGAQNGVRPPIPQQPPNLPQPPPPAPPRMGTPGLASGPAAGSGAGAPPRSQTPAKPATQSKYRE